MSKIDPEKLTAEEQAAWLAQQEEWADDGEDIMGQPLLVIWDLDGTLIDSERIVQRVVRGVVERRGCVYTSEVAKAGLGMRPREATEALIKATNGLGGASVDTVLKEASSMMDEFWPGVGFMPGAERALLHLVAKGIPLALATSTPSASLALKTSRHPILQHKDKGGVFGTIITGDRVKNGKPAPDIFLEAMRASGVTMDPKRVIVVEDSPAGVQAALAANMRVIAVPCPMPEGKKTDLAEFAGATAILSCLYDWRPEQLSLPPFEDLVGEVVPITPWLAKGPVVKGFGRGSKSLGIPTANLAPSSWDAVEGGVPAQTSGIYAGWSSRGDDPTVYATALSVGWNPHFKEQDKNSSQDSSHLTESHSSDGKTLEPWLLHDFGFDFYGDELRLVVCGYIRPEAPFTTMDALIARIREDARQTKLAFGLIPGSNSKEATSLLREHARSHFLRPKDWGQPTSSFFYRPTTLIVSLVMIFAVLSIYTSEAYLFFPLGIFRSAGSSLFGSYANYKFAVWICMCLHVLEAVIAFRSCLQSKLGFGIALKWAALTLVCGISSLSRVLLFGRSFIADSDQKQRKSAEASQKNVASSSPSSDSSLPIEATGVKKRKKSGSKKKKQNK